VKQSVKLGWDEKKKKKDIPSGECVVSSVLDVDDVERTRMSFARRDRADATQIVTTSDHDQVARVELDVVLDLVVLQVQAECVVDLDVRVRVAEGATVVGDQKGHALGADEQLLDFAELVLETQTFKRNTIRNNRKISIINTKSKTNLSLLLGDTVNGESSLNVIDKSEELVGLLDGQDI
jgi:hypothetical protein